MTVDLAERVSEWLRAADIVTVLTGAGISTDSGIPDFRGPQGVWTKNPSAERLSTLQDYVADPAVRAEAWRRRVENPAWAAKPNAAHHALAELELDGALDTVVTQNIDGLHQKAGSVHVIEIHGTALETVCLTCGDRRPMPEALDRVRAGETDPACRRCGGILKSATISFGQSLDPDVLAAAERATLACDLFIAIGTSLQVYPAAGLCDVARSVGAKLAIINAQPTPYDEVADAVIREPIGEVVPRLGHG